MHLRVRSRRPCRRESGRWGTLKGKEAHGRIGRFPIGNVRGTSRTRRRSKALESGTPPEVGGRRRPQGLRSRSWETIREGRGTRVQRRSNPTQVGGDGSSGDGSAFVLNGTPGRSGLRSRGTTPIRRKQATSDRSLGAKELRVYPEQPPRWPESRGKALETWLRPGRGVVVVTWGSTSVDRSITTMDRALRSTRRHRARCHPPPRRVGTTRAGPPRWLGLLRAVARRGREARVLRNDGQGSRRRCAQASGSLSSRALAPSYGPRTALVAARGREQRRRSVHPRFSGGAASAAAVRGRNQGGSVRAGQTRGRTTPVRIPEGRSSWTTAIRNLPRREAASAADLRRWGRDGRSEA